MHYKGRALRVGDHIDTDAIIPARFLVTSDPKILGENCMSGLEEDWLKQKQPGDIIVGGINFGCGSSREHAPIAIQGAGFQVVIAHSFARIFYRSAFNVGLLVLEIGDAVNGIQQGHQLDVDTDKGEIHNLTTGAVIKCPPLPPSLQAILDAGGLQGYVKAQLTGK